MARPVIHPYNKMTYTQTGFDFRDRGCAQVLGHTPESWVSDFEQQATALLRDQGSFTAEKVVSMIGQPPNHINAVGAVCRAYAKRNNLMGSYEKATNPSAHARVIIRWRLGQK